jgi:hypothetical protein
MILPNSKSEYRRVVNNYPNQAKYMVVPNGTDERLFNYDASEKKDDKLVFAPPG